MVNADRLNNLKKAYTRLRLSLFLFVCNIENRGDVYIIDQNAPKRN